MNINIKKGGLRQTVSLQSFKERYQQHGWEVDDTGTTPNEMQETVKTLAAKDENKALNYLAMKKRVPKKFNDGLFKSENGSCQHMEKQFL